MSKATGGQVIIDSSTCDAIDRGSGRINITDLGMCNMKGMKDPVHIYDVSIKVCRANTTARQCFICETRS